ncbi:MAG: hypothetical protein J7601_10920 [Chloroflexi bacterium]|nr:hypothetical protein [Chloroflexota bacterium]
MLALLQIFTQGAIVQFGIDEGDGQPARHVVSAVCNLLEAAKTAKHFGLGWRSATATDELDRYHFVMDELDTRHPLTLVKARAGIAQILQGQMKGSTPANYQQWYNLKYCTW